MGLSDSSKGHVRHLAKDELAATQTRLCTSITTVLSPGPPASVTALCDLFPFPGGHIGPTAVHATVADTVRQPAVPGTLSVLLLSRVWLPLTPPGDWDPKGLPGGTVGDSSISVYPWPQATDVVLTPL